MSAKSRTLGARQYVSDHEKSAVADAREGPGARRSEVETFASNSKKRKPIAPERSIWWVVEAIQEVFERDLAGEDEQPSAAVCKLVAVNLCAHASRFTHDSWPSVSTIAAETSLSRSTVQEALRKLERLGIVDRVPEGWQHKTATYRLRLVERQRIDDACLSLREKPCSDEVRDDAPPSGVRLRDEDLSQGPPPSALTHEMAGRADGQRSPARAGGEERPTEGAATDSRIGHCPHERLGDAPRASTEPFPPRFTPATRLGAAPCASAESTGPPSTRERGGGADPALPLALAMAYARSSYERALDARWGTGPYRDCSETWELMVRLGDRLKARAGVPLTEAIDAVADAYLQQTGRADGELERQCHPPAWLKHYCAPVERRALAMLEKAQRGKRRERKPWENDPAELERLAS